MIFRYFRCLWLAGYRVSFFFFYLQTSALSVLKVVFFVVWVLFSFLWFLSSIHSAWLELWMQEITAERTEELSSCSSCFLQEEVIWGRFVCADSGHCVFPLCGVSNGCFSCVVYCSGLGFLLDSVLLSHFLSNWLISSRSFNLLANT